MPKYKMMLLLSFGLLFSTIQAKADPVCTTNTLAYYISNVTTSANGCSIGNLDFWGFNGSNAGVTNSGPVSSGFTASQIELTPVSMGGEAGFMIAPVTSGGFTATATGVADAEVPFLVGCADGSSCLTDIVMSITGSATGTTSGGMTPGQSKLTETYCLGGTIVPPTGPCVGGSGVAQNLLTITPTSSGTATVTENFAGVSQISVDKDIQATGNNGTASITSVGDLFSTGGTTVSTPEPSALLMLGLGLIGLVTGSRYSRRQRLPS
jgi:hypothetical protein